MHPGMQRPMPRLCWIGLRSRSRQTRTLAAVCLSVAHGGHPNYLCSLENHRSCAPYPAFLPLPLPMDGTMIQVPKRPVHESFEVLPKPHGKTSKKQSGALTAQFLKVLGDQGPLVQNVVVILQALCHALFRPPASGDRSPKGDAKHSVSSEPDRLANETLLLHRLTFFLGCGRRQFSTQVFAQEDMDSLQIIEVQSSALSIHSDANGGIPAAHVRIILLSLIWLQLQVGGVLGNLISHSTHPGRHLGLILRLVCVVLFHFSQRTCPAQSQSNVGPVLCQ
mmetsp:Transcript_13537/g.24783  ORF Transcript_13537/g.24783 Transcript_13537/m.24783 type:complete len:279 (-) Transcript_13537:996-1832(-)